MSLLLRIAELVLIIIVVRAFLRMAFPAIRKPPASGKRSPKTERFTGNESDISDADYEDVK